MTGSQRQKYDMITDPFVDGGADCGFAFFVSVFLFLAFIPTKIQAADLIPTDSIPTEQRYDILGNLQVHTIQKAENLIELAVRYDVGYTEILTANPGVDPWLPELGSAIILPTSHLLPDAPLRGLIINLAEQRLYYFPTDGGLTQTYPIGIGRDGLTTPSGTTKIVRKKIGPSWRPTARMRKEDPELPTIVPPGPENPLGDYALYLGWSQYLLHGTNKPYGIGRRVSSGCIRLHAEHIQRLFAQVPIGTQVTVVDQPLKIGWVDGEMYMEVHPSQQQADAIEVTGYFEPEGIPDFIERVVAEAGEHVGRLDWKTVTQVARMRTGVPIQVTWRDVTERETLDVDQLSARELPARTGLAAWEVSLRMEGGPSVPSGTPRPLSDIRSFPITTAE